MRLQKETILKSLLPVLAWLLVCACPLQAQEMRFANKLLHELADKLSTSYGISAVHTGDVDAAPLHLARPITVHQATGGQIDHIGIRLFDFQLVEKAHAPLFRFAERYLLELLLADTPAAAQDRLRLERVNLTTGLSTRGDIRQAIRTVVASFSSSLSYYLSHADNRYCLVCREGDKNLLTLEFPARYELITGYTKLEAENAVYLQVMMHRPADKEEMPDELQEVRPGLFAAHNDYFMMESIVSTTYYTPLDKEGYRLVFTPQLPAESVCNLFNAGHDFGVMAEVTQSLYGNKTHTFEVSVRQLTDYFRAQHCTLYTAIQKVEKTKVTGALLAVHSELGYQHVLTFTIETGDTSTPIPMKMYSYVPIHNVSSIMEYKK